jgi:nitrite reductase/ring-hydroxylating ferredoxin subunit
MSTTKPEHRIGQLSDFPEHKIVTVEIEGRKIGVVRSGEAVHAFANRCPHHGAPMCAGRISGTMLPSKPDEYNFALDGLIVKCPWHAYEFNVETGDSLGGIMRARLPIYHTEVRQGEVFCTLAGKKRNALVTHLGPEEIGYGPD